MDTSLAQDSRRAKEFTLYLDEKQLEQIKKLGRRFPAVPGLEDYRLGFYRAIVVFRRAVMVAAKSSAFWAEKSVNDRIDISHLVFYVRIPATEEPWSPLAFATNDRFWEYIEHIKKIFAEYREISDFVVSYRALYTVNRLVELSDRRYKFIRVQNNRYYRVRPDRLKLPEPLVRAVK